MNVDRIPNKSWPQALAKLGIEAHISRVLIVGLGVTGLSVARFLHQNHIDFAVVDSRTNPPGLSGLHRISPDAPVFLGGNENQAFDVATHLVVSPGVPMSTPLIAKATDAGVIAYSDIDLFACVVKGAVVGITGSNGKSTVTSLLGLMAQNAGLKVKTGGNLGPAALDLLDEDAPSHLYILELSSFQLERTSLLKLAAGTILNISPDHMDRYPDIGAYIQSKQKIYTHCKVMVRNTDDTLVADIPSQGFDVLTFSLNNADVDFGVAMLNGDEWIVVRGKQLIRADALRIKGRHNLSNVLAALALGHSVNLPETSMVAALQVFPGLPHRMQWVREFNGVVWINDSKATNIGACLAALNGLKGAVVLIVGGDGKGADFSPLRSAVKGKVRALVLIGKDAPLLESLLSNDVACINARFLEQAVHVASGVAQLGDTVLLSPACASLDQFTDYQERGRVFERTVRNLSHAA